MPDPINIVTRKSPLAMAQTELVRACLQNAFPETTINILPVTTTGDRKAAWSLQEKGGKGLFTKELEDALLSGEADIAVHSAKDLPTDVPAGLKLAGFLPRERPNDVLILREGVETPVTVGTGSPRRRAQAKSLFPKAVWQEIRGNVETRLRKIATGDADATFLAAAGLKRLGIDAYEGVTFRVLTLDEMIPAAGQAAIALQCRSADVSRFSPALDQETGRAISIERRFLAALGGGCHSAYAVHYTEGELYLFHEDHGRSRIPFADTGGLDTEERIREIIARLGQDSG